jgi:glycosyltransferase involved in cell wall biosynthesis
MFYSVVVPARNAAATIGECLMGALSQSVPKELYEVLVVDDGSIDQTAAIARRLGVRVVAQPPLGTAAARNTGLRAAKGDPIVFLDPDCVPKLDWLGQMLAPFDVPAVVGVQGAYASDQDGLVPRWIQLEFDDRFRQIDSTQSINTLQCFSAGFRRSALVKTGGFDPTLGLGEDLDLSYRLARSGSRFVFAAKACVYHQHGRSLRRYLERAIRDGLWQSLVYARYPEALRPRNPANSPMSAQVPLVALTVVSLLLGARWRRLLPLSGVLAATFTGSVAPAAWRARRAGADVALAAPGIRFLHVLALEVGLSVGWLTLLSDRWLNRLRAKNHGS